MDSSGADTTDGLIIGHGKDRRNTDLETGSLGGESMANPGADTTDGLRIGQRKDEGITPLETAIPAGESMANTRANIEEGIIPSILSASFGRDTWANSEPSCLEKESTYNAQFFILHGLILLAASLLIYSSSNLLPGDLQVFVCQPDKVIVPGCKCEGTEIEIKGQTYCRGDDKENVCHDLNMAYDEDSDQCYDCPENSVWNTLNSTCACNDGFTPVLVEGKETCMPDYTCEEGFELNDKGECIDTTARTASQKKSNYLIYIIIAGVVVLMAVVGIAAFYKYRGRARKTELMMPTGDRGEAMLLDNVNMSYNFDNK